MSATDRPPISLEDARARLRELGYLDGRVERILFRRAFEGRGGLFLPALLAGAFAAALASLAAVEAAESGFAGSLLPGVVLFAHLFTAYLLPAAAGVAVATFAADRARRPAGAALAAAFLAAAAVLALWIAGSRGLGAGRADVLPWLPPVGAAALLCASAVRSGFIARAYAHSHRLPAAPRRGLLLSAALAGLAIAAAVLAFRGESADMRPPQPAAHAQAVRILALDGLALAMSGGPGTGVRRILERGAIGWWPAAAGSPPEIWTTVATGEPPALHGVRALERIRPAGSPAALRPPAGTRWYLARLAPAVGLASRAPVSVRDRRRLAFWEVAASAGLPALAVGWWASGPWPGATVVGNEEVFARAAGGAEVDRVARRVLAERALPDGPGVATVYLPSADILRRDAAARARAAGELEEFLAAEIASAGAERRVLVVLAVDGHPSPGALGRLAVFDGERASPGRRLQVQIRPEDVAPSILSRAGVPVARDLPGRPAAALFAPGTLEETTVATYGARVPPPAARRVTDREYLEKLKSLGYLQ